MNAFRLAADLLHLSAILYLIWKICRNRSCSSVSGKSQVLLAVVWATRYSDIFTNYVSVYNSVLKITFVSTAVVMITLIYWRHRSTYDHKNDTFRAEFLIVPCFMLALVVNNRFDFLEIMWTFSIYLEAVAMLPQLYMIAKTGLPEPMVGHYLMALAMYRTLYIVNWAYRYYFENFTDPIATISGCLQVTLLWSFLISFYAERKVHREEKLQIFIVDGRPTGFDIQSVTESLADIVYAADEDKAHSLKELQKQLGRRGVRVKNEHFKQHGFKNFKMFIEDQPWLVLFGQGSDWFVRRRRSREPRLARPLVDTNRRLEPDSVKEKEKEKPELEEEEGNFVDPYHV